MRKFLMVASLLVASLLTPGVTRAYIDCVYLGTNCINAPPCTSCHTQAEQVWYCVDTGEYMYILGGCCMYT